MDFVKKNIISIICIVVIIAVVIVKFVVLDGEFDKLQDEGKARVAVAGTLNRQITDKTRRWPRISPNDPAATALGQFPSQEVLKQGAEIRRQGEDQSARMYQLAVATNQQSHPVLTSGSLADLSSSDRVLFQQRLKNAEDDLRNGVLHGTLPPTREEMEVRAKQIWDQDFEHQKVIRDDHWVNEQELKQRYSDQMKLLPAQMRKERAEQFKLYVNQQALPIAAAALDSSRPMDPDQVWYSQMSLWIQKDVATTIHDMNAASKSIEEAPIKRLVAIGIVPDASMYVLNDASTSGMRMAPSAHRGSSSPNPSDTVDAIYTLSPTGRVCNSLFDVAHFDVRLDVDASQLQAFISALSTDRLLTVRTVNGVNVVDYRQLANEGFLYGNRPVVEVTLDCEELFMRQWTAPLMPAPIKRVLNISDDWKPWEPPASVAEAPMRR